MASTQTCGRIGIQERRKMKQPQVSIRERGNTALKCDVSPVIFHRKCNHPSRVMRREEDLST